MRGICSIIILIVSGLSSAVGGDIEGKLNLPEEIPASKVAVWLEGDGLEHDLDEPTPKISQRGARFDPDFLVISAGESVEMPNDDDIAHNVFSYSGPKTFNLGIYPKGEMKVVEFDVPGYVEMYCSIHRQMSAVVFIAPSSYRTRTDENGTFRFADVPKGKYRLKLWAKGLDDHEYPINVNEGVPTRVEFTPRPPSE